VTCLKCGGIFKQEFVANLLPSRLVKIFFENRIIVSEVMAKSLVSCFFDSRCRIQGCLKNHQQTPSYTQMSLLIKEYQYSD